MEKLIVLQDINHNFSKKSLLLFDSKCGAQYVYIQISKIHEKNIDYPLLRTFRLKKATKNFKREVYKSFLYSKLRRLMR